jgi:hypothetical protein
LAIAASSPFARERFLALYTNGRWPDRHYGRSSGMTTSSSTDTT